MYCSVHQWCIFMPHQPQQRARCVDSFLEDWITKHTGADDMEAKKAQLLRPGWETNNILSFNDKSFGAGGDKPFIGIYYVGGSYTVPSFLSDLREYDYPSHLADQIALHSDALEHLRYCCAAARRMLHRRASAFIHTHTPAITGTFPPRTQHRIRGESGLERHTVQRLAHRFLRHRLSVNKVHPAELTLTLPEC